MQRRVVKAASHVHCGRIAVLPLLQGASWACRRACATVGNGSADTDAADWAAFAAGVSVHRPPAVDAETAERQRRTQVFLGRVMTLPKPQDAADMITAALRLRTLRATHVAAFVAGATRGARPWCEAGEAPEQSKWNDATSGNDGDGDKVLVPYERALFVFDTILFYGDEPAATDSVNAGAVESGDASARAACRAYIAELANETSANRLLAAVLSHLPGPLREETPSSEAVATADLAAYDAASLRRLSVAAWRLCQRIEQHGWSVVGAASLDRLGRLLEAVDGRAADAQSSASVFTTRREFLDEQRRAATTRALRGDDGTATARLLGRRAVPREAPEPRHE